MTRPWNASATVAALALAGLLVGCQAVTEYERHGEADFSRLWSLYRECQQERDRERLLLLAESLSRWSREARWRDEQDRIAVRLHVSPPPVRLAVDPDEMARACARREAFLDEKHRGIAESMASAGPSDVTAGAGYRAPTVDSL